MFCYCKPLPHIIALATLYCTLAHLTIPISCHNVVQATQQSTTAATNHESNALAINATSATANPTEQICSTKMLKNTSLCKPCTCDPVGSESPNCDQLTRRCSCRPGYSGNKCVNCSYGFFNLTTRTPESAGLELWRCNTCGPCFDIWQARLTPLKEQAIDLIKRASNLDGMFLNHLDLDPMTSKLVLNSSGTNILDTLDNSVQTIGERILENKRASDQINMLSSELNSTVIAINKTDFEMTNQTRECKEIEAKLENLNYGMLLHSDTQRQLTKSLDAYREELLDIQEFIPEGAIRLIRANRNRTRKALACILEHNQKFSPVLESSLSNFRQMLDKVKYSKRQMKHIGSQILNETLNTHPLDVTDFHHQFINHRHSSPPAAYLNGPARSITELDMQLFDSYQANFDNRTYEMSETRRHIEDAKSALLQAGNRLTAFETSLTSIDQTVSSLNGTSGCDFEQLVENATQIVRASLDRIDVRWPAAQAELADLTLKARFVNETTRHLFSNLSSELNSALSENLSSLLAFRHQANQEADDISDVRSLQNRTKLLSYNLYELSRKLNKLAELKQVTSDLHNQTKLLNANVTSEQATMTTDTNNDTSSVLARPNTLIADSKSALERVRSHQSESFGTKMTTDWILADQIDRLTNATDENIQLSQQVSDRVAELSSGLLIVNGHANMKSAVDVKNSTRLSKLHDKRRLTNIVNDLRHISQLIHRGLMQSQNLSADFNEYERTFARQAKMIDSLHREIDVINIDLKRKSDYYEECPTSP